MRFGFQLGLIALTLTMLSGNTLPDGNDVQQKILKKKIAKLSAKIEKKRKERGALKIDRLDMILDREERAGPLSKKQKSKDAKKIESLEKAGRKIKALDQTIEVLMNEKDSLSTRLKKPEYQTHDESVTYF